MGKWRKCLDCPKGFSSLTKRDAHAKEAHPVQVLTKDLRWAQGELDALERQVRRYHDAKKTLESLTPLLPGARELLQEYVTDLEKHFGWQGRRTRLQGVQERIPTLRKYTEELREKLRRSTYMKAL